MQGSLAKNSSITFGDIDHFVLFGGGRVLANVALKLRSSGYAVRVVTSERHRNEFLPDSPGTFESFLADQELEVTVSDDVNDDSRVLGYMTDRTLGISFGAAWIFEKEFIDRFEGRLLNSHGSRLPQDRGGGGFSWRILRGDRQGFSLIHQVAPGIDTGTIVAYNEYLFPHHCRIPVDYQNYSLKMNLELLDMFLEKLRARSEFECVGQPEYLSTYWPRLSTDLHGYIDWGWSATEIEQFVCAFDDPYRGASSFVNGTKVRLKKCLMGTSDGTFHPFQYGIIFRASGSAIHVAAKGGSLIFTNVTAEDGTDMMGRLGPGDRFYTDREHLDEAKRRRVIYTPRGLK
ncbi:MAG: hypothetical protein HY735_00075 [Verrucomicrobia bacterium]|nr:hypothetical protein [Verrucomicrobiota bacterium]